MKKLTLYISDCCNEVHKFPYDIRKCYMCGKEICNTCHSGQNMCSECRKQLTEGEK